MEDHQCDKFGGLCTCDHSGDIRDMIMSVFLQHTDYTGQFIQSNLPIAKPNQPYIADRLMRNPGDMAKVFSQIKRTSASASQIQNLFYTHLSLASDLISALGNNQATDMIASEFYDNANQIGTLLGSINPSKLNQIAAQQMMYQHNKYVVTLSTLQLKQKYSDYITIYDEYTDHIKQLAEAIYLAVL